MIVPPVVPVQHFFDFDAKRGRFVALRFVMSDGSERAIPAAQADVVVPFNGRLVDERA